MAAYKGVKRKHNLGGPRFAISDSRLGQFVHCVYILACIHDISLLLAVNLVLDIMLTRNTESIKTLQQTWILHKSLSLYNNTSSTFSLNGDCT